MAVSNVNREYRNDRTSPANTNAAPRRADIVAFPQTNSPDENPLHTTTDEQFRQSYDRFQNEEKIPNRNTDQVDRQYMSTTEPVYAPPRRIRTPKKKVKHKPSTATMLVARTKVTAINVWAGGWMITWYLCFQWWLSLLSLVGLGMAAAVYSILSSIQETTLGGVLTFFVGDLTSGISGDGIVSRVIAGAFDLFGITFDPIFLFFVPSIFLLLVGTLILMTTWAIYSVSGIHSLSGNAKGLKLFYFLIALISSVTPLPLFILWLMVVWKNPK